VVLVITLALMEQTWAHAFVPFFPALTSRRSVDFLSSYSLSENENAPRAEPA
jgi:hypothetical protein